MTFKTYQKILFLFFALALSTSLISCSKSTAKVEPGKAASPTEAYKMLYAAVKSKDTEKIKSMMSKGTVSFAEGVSQQQKKSVADVFANGFTATTFAETMPEIRDERIKDNYGNVEVFNKKDNRWEDLPFIKEDDGWKLAVGNIFAGTFDSPGKSQAQLQNEQSNTNMIPYPGSVNGSFPSGNSNTRAEKSNVNTAQVMPEKKVEKEEKKK